MIYDTGAVRICTDLGEIACVLSKDVLLRESFDCECWWLFKGRGGPNKINYIGEFIAKKVTA